MILEEYNEQNEERSDGEQIVNATDETSERTDVNAADVSDELAEESETLPDDDLSAELEALADDLQEQMTQPEEIPSEEEQPEEEQPEEEQPEDEQSEEEQPEEEQSEEEQSEEEQSEEEQSEEEQPEEEQSEEEQSEEEQPEEELVEEEPSEAQILAERISDLVDGLQEAFSDSSEPDEEEISADELLHIADELAADDTVPCGESADDGAVEYEPSGSNSEIELNDLASAMSALSLEVNSFIEDDEDDDVKVFVKKSEMLIPDDDEDDDVKIFVKKSKTTDSDGDEDDVKPFVAGGVSGIPDEKTADDGMNLSAQEPDIEHTNVFQPVCPQPAYGETGSYSPYYGSAAAQHRKKRYGLFKGLKQIAGLLVIIIGIAWLFSFVAFSVMGEKDTVNTEPYDYSTTSTIIKPFHDDQEPEPIIVPEFTAEQLTEGDTGDMVDAVQKTLASLGYLAQSRVSGTYDKATRNAVMQFQKANFLDVTGVVDKTTYSLIFDSNATAPTTRTTDLPTTTGSETSSTKVQTSDSESETQTTPAGAESTTASASAEETKPTAAASAESSAEEGTTASSTKKTNRETAENTKKTTASESETPSSKSTESTEKTTGVESKLADPVG